MNNNLQLVLKSSTTEMSLNDHDAGIYIVPELDGLTGLPEIRTTSGVNAGYDGGWTSAQKFDARSIVIRGVIANDDKTEVERMRRELVALLAQGKNEQLELDFVTETGRAYEVQVRTIACDMAMQRVLTQQEFMVTLRADDPLIYDNSSAGEEATVNVSGATGGFRIPFEVPLAIDAGSEETVVQNSGLESVAPTIKMYGALHNPKIINHTTNQAMQVEAELGFTEGAWTTPVDAPEGTNVSFEPGREAPIESAKLKGDTYQQTYTGKNLYPLIASTTTNGIIYTQNADGTYDISGKSTAAANAIIWLDNISAFTNGETYTLSVSPAPTGMQILVEAYNNTTWQRALFVGSGSAPIITSAIDMTNTNRIKLSLRVPSTGTTVSLQGLKIQLEKGSTDTAWERYVGGIPAPNPDYSQEVQTVTGEQTVNICGKNLLDIANNLKASDAGLDFSYSNDKLVVSGTPTRSYANVTNEIDTYLAAGQYTLSLSEAVNHRVYLLVRYTDGTAASLGIINAGSLSATTTFTKDVVKIRLDFSVMTTQVALSESFSVQLEKGSAKSDFEPYQGQSYTVDLGSIELCRIGTYQDYIYKDGTDWKIHKATNKTTLTGSFYWGTDAYGRYYTNNIVDYAGSNNIPFSSHFVGNTNVASMGNVPVRTVAFNQDNATPRFYIGKYDIWADTDALKTWLNSNLPSIYYALATATDTAITEPALIAQLEALVDGNAVVYEGETNIAVGAAVGDMPGITAIRYYTDKEPDQRDELIIDSRLKTITLNGLDVYHLQAPGSEFLMLAPGENKLSLQSDIVGDNGYAKVSYKQGYLSI